MWIPLFIYLPCYFPGATFKSLPELLGLSNELLGVTTDLKKRLDRATDCSPSDQQN